MQAILDTLTRIPGLVWLSAGQLDGMSDSVLTQVTVYGPSNTLVTNVCHCSVDGEREVRHAAEPRPGQQRQRDGGDAGQVPREVAPHIRLELETNQLEKLEAAKAA